MWYALVLVLAIPLAEFKVHKVHSRYPFDLPKTFGAWVMPTSGAIWPEPQLKQTSNDFLVLRPMEFEFKVSFSFKILIITVNLHNP